MNLKKLLLASVIFLLAAGCNQKQASQPVAVPDNQQADTASSTNYVVTPSNNDVKPVGQTQTRQNADKPDYQPSAFTVTQTVEGSNLNKPAYDFKEGQTALDLLKASHQVEVKSYSFGDMVTSIDGNKADTKHFWEFFVNGKSSSVGAGSYKLQNEDKIEWKLSEIK